MTTNGSGVYSITANNSANWNTAYGWGDHSTQSYATQSYVGTQISNLVDSSPATLNTLNELAAALGDDPNFATTTANSIGTKLPLAGGTLTGSLTITGGTAYGLNITTSGTQDTININRAANNDNAITKYQTASADKWIVGLRNTGDDNFRFYSYGTSSDVLTIDQANGNATFAGDITTSGKVNAGDRILTEATTSNALLQVKYNSSNYLEGYYDKLNVVGGDFLLQRGGDTKIKLTAVGTTFTNLSNTSAASSSVDEIKIGTFGAGRPAIYFGSSNTTYTNSTWFIENIGAAGKLRIGRNGLDIVEIFNDGSSTFAGDLSSSGTSKSLKYWRRLWADANNDWGLNNNAGSGVISVSGMGTPSTSTTTFAGSVIANNYISIKTASSSGSPYIDFIQNTTQKAYIQFNNGANALNFQSDNAFTFIGGSVERVRIDGSGNLGIGTTSIPNPFSSAYSNILQVGTTGGNTRLAITAGSTSSSDLNFADSNDATNVGSYVGAISYKHNGDYMLFSTNGSEKMRVTSTGNVGIGETSPPQKLTVNGGVFITDDITSPGSAGTYTYNATAIDYSGSGARFWSWGDATTRGTFNFIQLENDGTNQQTALSIDSSGNATFAGDVTAYSDKRVKENIKTIDNSLEKVNQLRGVEFNKIGEDKKSIGVIAQEIEKILPEVVREDDKGMKSVAYGNITGILIEAIKELTAKVERLENNKCNCK